MDDPFIISSTHVSHSLDGYITIAIDPNEGVPWHQDYLSADDALELGFQLIDMAMTMKGNHGSS